MASKRLINAGNRAKAQDQIIHYAETYHTEGKSAEEISRKDRATPITSPLLTRSRLPSKANARYDAYCGEPTESMKPRIVLGGQLMDRSYWELNQKQQKERSRQRQG